jgi:hypothetical protein
MWRIWGRREMCTGFWQGKLKERDHLVDLREDGRILLKLILRDSVDWISLAQSKDKWWSVVDAIASGFQKMKGMS